jgi:uncharacterized protein (TIGR03067 family)
MQAFMLLVFLAPEAGDAAVQKDIGRLDGTWTVTAAESKGRKMDKLPVERVIFAAGKAGAEAAKAKGAGVFTYRLDPGQSPKVIEATAAGEKGNRQGLVGIYEVGADTLKVCLVPGGTKPPAEFKTGPDDGAMVLDLKRDKK